MTSANAPNSTAIRGLIALRQKQISYKGDSVEGRVNAVITQRIKYNPELSDDTTCSFLHYVLVTIDNH
jgi:hypothetical protein